MKRIVKIEFVREVDDSPDFSWIGKYAAQPGPEDRTIDRQERGDMDPGHYRYFIAANSAKETGNPESVEQDYQRMESYNRSDWCFIGIRARAELVVKGIVQIIQSAGLWGIESDSDESYLQSIEQEELASLCGQLKELGFSDKEIATAKKEMP